MKANVRYILYSVLVFFGLSLTAIWIGYTIQNSAPEDFRVFYESARAAFSGQSIYRTYGPINLPYWYLPWLAWFYIPLGLFSYGTAYVLYVSVSILCAFFAVDHFCNEYIPTSDRSERLFIVGMALSMCWLLFRVGQMDFILLAATGGMIYLIASNRGILAGAITPILLFKPHLYILYLPAALYKGKKQFLLGSLTVCLALIELSFLIIPDWPQQMLHMLAQSGQRTDNNWNFTTLPNMLGLQENWSGTANLPFTILLILVGFALLWKFRSLGTYPLLSLALAGSLFCAPRAYAYNFPLLIPAMIWICADWPKAIRFLFWLAAAILPFFFRFSSGTYLLVLAVFAAGLFKAQQTIQQTVSDVEHIR